MKNIYRLIMVGLVISSLMAATGCHSSSSSLSNPQIDPTGFENAVFATSAEREAHRVTEEQFIALMARPGYIILDARSESKYRLRHIKGAINLPFTEFTTETLARVIPAKSSNILIYCNNNFEGAPDSFPTKAISAALNLSTYVSLRTYGYHSVFELGPLLDVEKTKIPFEGEEVALHR